jgi:hypothetical protein
VLIDGNSAHFAEESAPARHHLTGVEVSRAVDDRTSSAVLLSILFEVKMGRGSFHGPRATKELRRCFSFRLSIVHPIFGT